jgi:hypothetical protein
MSLYFDGNVNSYLSLPNVDGLDFGTGDFTIEWWMYQTYNNPFPRVFQIGSYFTSVSIGVSVELAGGDMYVWTQGSLNSVGSNEFDTWNHYAICRVSGVVSVYKNGVSVASFSDTNNYVSAVDLLIGNETDRSQNAAFTGYIVGFSWSKGISRYNADFTPPLSLPVVDSYTQFVLGGSSLQGPLASSIVNSNVLLDQSALPTGYGVPPPPPPPPPPVVVQNPLEQPLRRLCCRGLVFGVDDKKTEKKGYTRILTSNYSTLGKRRR